MSVAAKNVIFERYRVLRKLGKGSFGKLYSGVDVKTGAPVAIKFEIKKTSDQKQLAWEYHIYKRMAGTKLYRDALWPSAHQLGQKKCGSLIMVMDLLGRSLEAVSRPASPGVVAHIALHVVTALRKFHENGFVHRDIKLGNLLLSRDASFPAVMLVDYGLATRVKTADKYADGRGLKGTVRYTSVNTHLGVEQNARDDLQSFGYVLFHLAGVALPWFVVRKSSDKKRSYYTITKEKLRFDPWSAGAVLPKDLGTALAEYLSYVNSLPFHVWPNYDFLLALFQPLVSSFDGHIPFDT